MGQSLSQLYIHLTFGTKYREPMILPDRAEALHRFMATMFQKWESPAVKINSVPDHVHVLFRLSKNYALAKVVEEVKKNSSKFMKQQGVHGFKWQIGYGAFSVSSSKADTVTHYIATQAEHHADVDYRQEVETFIREYDPDFFWESRS